MVKTIKLIEVTGVKKKGLIKAESSFAVLNEKKTVASFPNGLKIKKSWKTKKKSILKNCKFRKRC